MNIVVLDGYTLNPGDLSWHALESLGTCRIYDRTPDDEVVSRAENAPIVLINKTELSGHIIGRLPRLKYVGLLATGYNVIDIAAARQHGVTVTNVPSYGAPSVAQMVFAHLLNLAQHVAHHAATVADGRWGDSEDFCYWDYPLVELAGLTMGIVGIGRIGQATAKLATAFGMKVIAHDTHTPAEIPAEVEMVDLDTVFSRADVVSLHCPLTAENHAVVNAERLALMKPSAWLINTARGPLVEQQAMADALNQGRLAGAGLDVLCEEPPPRDNPLLAAKNCFVTPHIAWATSAARERLLGTVVQNVKAFLDGRPRNVVNP